MPRGRSALEMGDAACCGTERLLLALLLSGSFACNFPVLFLYSFVPHLKLAVVQGVTASTQRLETSAVFCQCL